MNYSVPMGQKSKSSREVTARKIGKSSMDSGHDHTCFDLQWEITRELPEAGCGVLC